MSGIVEYVLNCEDTFAQRDITHVDSLVMSWISNMKIPENVPQAGTAEGILLSDLDVGPGASKLVEAIFDPEDSRALLHACAMNPRFSDIKVCHAVQEWSKVDEKQFAAVTLEFDEGAYISFRGTDDTLLGWKENCNMAFEPAVPSQLAARKYLDNACRELDCPIWVGGHSKGGNLAVYASMTCDDASREHIQCCFCHDGPGFTLQTTSDPSWRGSFQIVDRTIPHESVVGLLFGGMDVEPTVVESTNSGVLQHSPFSWVVDGNDFSTMSSISYETYRTDKRLNSWIGHMSIPDRERFVEVLYMLANSTGEITFSGMMSGMSDGSMAKLLQGLDMVSEEDRKFFTGKMNELAAILLLDPRSMDRGHPLRRRIENLFK